MIINTLYCQVNCNPDPNGEPWLAGAVNEYGERLFAFVGEKIDVIDSEPNTPDSHPAFDHIFIAQYRVLENVFGSLSVDTIEFRVRDHYGYPQFATYNHVLLYVSEYEGKYYHQRYQFDAVYTTEKGKWAGIYDGTVHEYLSDHNFPTKVVPEEIEFDPPVEININNFDIEYHALLFPKPYFEIKDSIATARYGHYVEDLFQLRKDGILKVRGFFE